MEELKINSLNREVIKKVMKLIRQEYQLGKQTLESENNTFDEPNGIYNACVLAGVYLTCDDTCFDVVYKDLEMLKEIYNITHNDPVSAIFHLNLRSYQTVDNLEEFIEFVEDKLAQIIISN